MPPAKDRMPLLAAVVTVAFLNLAPPGWSRHLSTPSGGPSVGFPFGAYGVGEFGPYFDLPFALVDVAFGIALVWCVVKLCEVGPQRLLNKLRRWGTPMDSDLPTDPNGNPSNRIDE